MGFTQTYHIIFWGVWTTLTFTIEEWGLFKLEWQFSWQNFNKRLTWVYEAESSARCFACFHLYYFQTTLFRCEIRTILKKTRLRFMGFEHAHWANWNNALKMTKQNLKTKEGSNSFHHTPPAKPANLRA